MDADEETSVMELRNRSITKYNNIVLAKLNKLFDDAIPRSALPQKADEDPGDRPLDCEAQMINTLERDASVQAPAATVSETEGEGRLFNNY